MKNLLNKMKQTILFSLSLVGTLFIVACAPPQDPLPEIQKASLTSVVKTNNVFSINLFKQVVEEKKNTFLSPYSVATALSMLSAGAKGETKKEILKALSYGVPENEMHKANAWLMINLNNRGRFGNFDLNIVNRLWGQQNYPFSSTFLKLLKDNYLAELATVDFKGAPQAAREQINKWVEAQTKGKIKDLMSKDSISQLTRLVLVNAIYFKGEWLNKFEEKSTDQSDFHLDAKTTIKVPMMHSSEIKGDLMENDSLKLLSLPYKGEELAMVIIMPKKGKTLQTIIEKQLNDDTLKTWLKQATTTEDIQVALPKFELNQKFKLKDILNKMGIKKVFMPDAADLSGINDGKEPLYLSYAIHKSFIVVNEEGTEAAAATGFGIRAGAAPSFNSFIVDRPFLFMIYDHKTESILFMGKIYDPTK